MSDEYDDQFTGAEMTDALDDGLGRSAGCSKSGSAVSRNAPTMTTIASEPAFSAHVGSLVGRPVEEPLQGRPACLRGSQNRVGGANRNVDVLFGNVPVRNESDGLITEDGHPHAVLVEPFRKRRCRQTRLRRIQ